MRINYGRRQRIRRPIFVPHRVQSLFTAILTINTYRVPIQRSPTGLGNAHRSVFSVRQARAELQITLILRRNQQACRPAVLNRWDMAFRTKEWLYKIKYKVKTEMLMVFLTNTRT